MKKRIMKIMLAVITCATVGLNYIPVNAATTGVEFTVSLNNQDVTFKIINVNEGEVQLGTGAEGSENQDFEGTLTIPETVTYEANNYKVVKVAEIAFADNKKITSVIGNNITSIGDSAFYGCTSLTSIDFSKATVIGWGAFDSCTLLTDMSLPEVTDIDSSFYGCTSLTSINLPEVKKIGGGTFTNCIALKDIILPKVTEIEGHSFNGCTSLTSIKLPEATVIGDGAFNGCSKLESISLPKATKIGASTFAKCIGLTSINLPEATEIGQYAFWECSKLESISLPKATKIGYGAFLDCTSLKSMVLGITKGENYDFDEIGEYPDTIYLLDKDVEDVSFGGNSYKDKDGSIAKYDIDIIADPVSVIQEQGKETELSVDATISLEDPWKNLSYQWEKEINGVWVSIDGKTEATLVFNSLTKEDAGKYQCTVTSVANPALEKTTAEATITVDPSVEGSIITGIVDGATYKKGITLDVSVAGAGMDNKAPIKGAIRYQPKSWKVDTNKGVFTDTYATTIETKDLTVGNKTLEVTFDQQIFNDGTWNTVARTTYTKNIQFHLEAAVIEEDKSETGDTTKIKNPKTGDTTNIGYLSLGVLISGIIIIGCLKKKKVTR